MFKTDEMLGKNLLLTTFCLFLCISTSAASWQKAEVSALINSDHYFITDESAFHLSGIEEIAHYVIYTVTGQKVYESHTSSPTIEVNLPTGKYILKIVTQQQGVKYHSLLITNY